MMAFRFLDSLLRRDSRSVGVEPALDLTRVEALFDPDFYAAQIGPDLHPDAAFTHFLRDGWRDGNDPSAAFSVAEYLARNPDVAADGMNPLIHYVKFGKAEGRVTSPSTRERLVVPVQANAADQVAQLLNDAEDIAGDVDRCFYAAVSGLRFDTPQDAALHYLRSGWRLDLDPSPNFSTRDYLRHYPDVAQAGIPPLLHYVRAGRAEGRIARDIADDVARLLATTPDLSAMEADWQLGRDEPQPLDDVGGAAQLLAALDDGSKRLVVAFTHDDFRSIRGGVQLCVGQEADIAAARGITYLALYPARPRPRLAPDPAETALYAVVGDTRIGPFLIDSLLPVLVRLSRSRHIDILLHVLLGHAPEHIARVAKAARVGHAYAWFHDATLLCPSYALQRNQVAHCGAPPPDSSACTMCLFGEERRSHLARLRAMMDVLPLHALAPSRAAADMVASRTDLPFADITVIPHATLQEDRDTPAVAAAAGGATTVAFVGAPVHHKGYTVFRRLLRQNLGRDDLRFLYFGDARHCETGMQTIGVDVTPEAPEAMIDALRREQVDFVIHWANWEETFSFSTYEAIRAGADVITHPRTGNVAALVEQTGRGHILPDEAALAGFLRPESLARATSARRAPRHPILSRTSLLSFAALDAAETPKQTRQAKSKTSRRAKTAATRRRRAGGLK